MVNIIYDEEKTLNFYPPSAPRGLIGFLIRRKWAKTSRQASLILLGIAVICLVLTAFILWPAEPATNFPPPLYGDPMGGQP